ncbi:unnamed protein product, partial [Rotaria sp. Silwood1]
MNAICEDSLYNRCLCKEKYNLPINLPLYDGHCHVDLFFKYGLNENIFNKQLSNGRKIILIDNRHQYNRWFINYGLESPNIKIYTTYGIHPKYISLKPQNKFKQLNDIFGNKFTTNTTKVAIGECGIDATSKFLYDVQLNIFRYQLKLAAELNLPVILHGRGSDSFQIMLYELKHHLNYTHRIYWHSINQKADLPIISNFLQHFSNSNIGLNGSSILQHNDELQKNFNNWLHAQDHILNRIILESDFPFLRPPVLQDHQYNPIS